MTKRAQVQFIWHLHQPYYAVPDRPSNMLPWVRLHATKAYYDMGCMLQRYPKVRGVLNFSGSLLKQLHEYVELGKRDLWWDLTVKPASALTEHDKAQLLQHFFSINWETCIRPLPRYWELLERRGPNPPHLPAERYNDGDWRDLQVLFNLAWFGFSARAEFPLLRELIEKGRGYTPAEKQAVLELQLDIMRRLVPLYRDLHQSGQIEVSLTPMYHPIMPLVIDTDTAARATPHRPRPPRLQAREDARYHIQEARRIAEEFLGIQPRGMWPSEGSVSPEAVELFAEEGVEWIATDEDVLRHSRGSSYDRGRDLYRAWRLGGQGPAMFFRDHGLSDQIGFVYSKNEPRVAVDDLLHRIRATHAPNEGVMSIILDGENPWEHYKNDGQDFLEELYQRLSDAQDIETTYPSRYMDQTSPSGQVVGKLDRLHSGSWIMGNYQIWIGHSETNRAWELLGQTRRRLVERAGEGGVAPENLRRAWEAIYIAQGSDWFWWYGDDFSTDQDTDFDRLFRSQLRYVYAQLGEQSPVELEVPILTDHHQAVVFKQPEALIHPQIDGKSEYFYEWSGAGLYRNTGAHGSMFETTRLLDVIHLGFDLENLYLRIDPGPDFHPANIRVVVRIQNNGDSIQLDLSSRDGGMGTLVTGDQTVPLPHVAFADSLEASVPFAQLGATPGNELRISFTVWEDAIEMERHPDEGHLVLQVPDETFEAQNWMV